MEKLEDFIWTVLSIAFYLLIWIAFENNRRKREKKYKKGLEKSENEGD